MSLKHLGPGSICPALKPNTLRLYSMVFCPYAERSRLVLAAKKIEYETVNVNLIKKADWFLALNPAGQVPVLQHGLGDERVLPESLVISEYLDNLYPENRLQSTDPFINASHKLLIERFSKVTTGFYKLLRGNEEASAAALEEILQSLKPYETALKSSTFFGGDKPLMVDYMIWPWFERFGFLKIYKNFELKPDNFPNLIAYIQRMYEQPEVKEVVIETEIYEKFFKSYLAGEEPDYDVGLKNEAA